MDIRERLNQIDHKCLDEDLKFLDLRSLYEASKLSYEDKKEIEKVLRDTDDPETIAAVITAKSKKNEGYEENEFENDLDESFDDRIVKETDEFRIVKDSLNGKKDVYSLWLQSAGPREPRRWAPTTMYFDTVEEAENYYNRKYLDEVLNIKALTKPVITIECLKEDINERVKLLRNRLLVLNKAIENGEDPESVAWEKEKIFNELDKLGVNYYDECLKEASYGGAYDIEDDMFFTKEELMEFAVDLAEQYIAWSNHEKVYIEDLYIRDDNWLVIELYDGDDEAYHSASVKIDMRKIRLPKDIYKYSDAILKQWKDSYNKYHEYDDEDIDESLTEDMYDSVKADLESIEKFLKDEKFYNYEVSNYDFYPLGTSRIDLQVNGDWKHDHLLFKNLIQEWADKNNRKIFKIDSKEVGQSDSDYYTALYSVFIAKDDESFDTLNSMRGLFQETLNESIESPYFKAFITNLGKYNEGELVGKWVEFPIDEDDFEEVLTSIGIGSNDEFGTPYEEWFVTDYECNIPGFNWQELGEYPSYETLQNYGEVVNSISDLEAVSNALEVTGDLESAIEGIDNGNIMYIPGISSDSDLAYYYIDNVYGGVENLDNNTLETYFDYEALGRDLGFDTYEDGVEEVSAGEYWCGDENASDEEIGYAYVDAVGISGVANSGNYFDYEAFGRDLSDDYTFTSDGVVLTESVLNESIGTDLSDIPLIDKITFINKKKSMMPGIYNENELVNVLNKVGKNKFKVRTTTFGSNVSYADIKDSWMSLNRKGWSITKAIDNSLNGFNEVYVCTKHIDEDLKEGTYNDRVKFLPKDKLLKIIDVQKNMKSVDWEDDPDSEYYEKNYKNEIDDYNIRRYGFTW